ncbi:hypothetical protein GMI70_02555 [Eggerthellaceae bacterium zg-893]|nr:hypothetical protein [Eggerthellaceae bacterium zg-893]
MIRPAAFPALPALQKGLAAALALALAATLGGCSTADGPGGSNDPGQEPGQTAPASEFAPVEEVHAASDYDEVYHILDSANAAMQAEQAAWESDRGTDGAAAESADATSTGSADAAASKNESASEPEAEMQSETAASVSVDAATGAAADAEAPDHSDTNVQVEGIDEGDIVKTDGEYLYRLSAGQDVVILSADGADSAEVARISLPFETTSDDGTVSSSWPAALYLHDGKLVVVRTVNYWKEGQHRVMPILGAEVGETTAAAEEGKAEANSADATAESEETAGEPVTITGMGGVTEPHGSALSASRTLIDVYDVSDPASPAALYSVAQDGSYHDSRLMDGSLTLLTSSYVWDFDAAKADDPATYVPCTYDDQEKATPVAAEDVCILPGKDAYGHESYTTVSLIDLASGAFSDSLTMLGEAEQIYMSPNALYVTQSVWEETESEPYEESVYTATDIESSTSTTITRLPLGDGTIDLGASCTLPGYLRNQFNMDEYDGNLRVALNDSRTKGRQLEDPSHGVSSYEYLEETQVNALYVLDESMETIGSIEDMAPGEEIKSVRFDGATGYVVTFKQIDPLFAIDLSDPQNPAVLSALKIPGFSSYLHPFGEGRLLGFGQTVEDDAATGLKLSMFDTSDPTDVREIAQLPIDGDYSDGLYDHKAVFVSVEHGIIGVPVDEGYQLFTYTDADGFAPFPLSDGGGALDAQTIGSHAQPRGLFSGGDLYVCSDWTLVAYGLADGDLLTVLPFKDQPEPTAYDSEETGQASAIVE